ncbi:MAG: phytanoyl-CoA dioxygenase family protein [Hyphomicrobiaceae bacterium]
MLSAEQRCQFDQQGFLRVRDVLEPATYLDPIVEEYSVLLDELAISLLESGQISSRHADLDFRSRMTKIYAETGQTFAQYFNLSLPLTGVQEDTPFWTGAAIFNLIKAPALLDVVESVIGSEIASNPIQHVRIKPPEKYLAEAQRASGLSGATPWHQDAAVISPDSGTELITVWVPINDVSAETGCLQFMEGGHKMGLMSHGFGPVDGLALRAEIAGDQPHVSAVPARRGDIVLIHRHCPHASLPNTSELLRFSLDLRYHPAHQNSGRNVMPSFIARIRREPSRELNDAAVWKRMWTETRHWLATSSKAPTQAYEWLSG